MRSAPLPGALAPTFFAPALNGNPSFAFDTVAGRHVVLLFVGSAGWPPAAEALRLLAHHRALFDDHRSAFFGVTSDQSDAAEGRIASRLPGIRWFLDYDRHIAQLYGVANNPATDEPRWFLLDPMLRVLDTAPVEGGAAILSRLEDIVAQPQEEGVAPVLIVPRIFDRAFCRRLIELYDEDGGSPSGFMRDENGTTVGRLDDAFKRRRDFVIKDSPEIREAIHLSLRRALLPLIERTFHFRVTRVERELIACYNGDGGGGYFHAHRDNSAAGTAHRRFACTINLNAEDYEGGELNFPEFGSRLYRPPTGGAAVFSCSLLHRAMPVTKGKRYVYLPFFYDEAAARQREEIARAGRLEAGLAHYRA